MLLHYSLLKGIVAKDLEEFIRKGSTHHNLILSAGNVDYQVNIDIQSAPTPNVKVFVKDNFSHSLLSFLEELPENALTPLTSSSHDYRLDYLRTGIFSAQELAQAVPEEALKISDLLDASLREGSSLWVLGEFYGKEISKTGPLPHGLNLHYQYPHLPPQGLHDIHFNQGNPSTFPQSQDNGIFQDGAIFLRRSDHTVQAFFFMFDTQCVITDEAGNCLP